MVVFFLRFLNFDNFRLSRTKKKMIQIFWRYVPKHSAPWSWNRRRKLKMFRTTTTTTSVPFNLSSMTEITFKVLRTWMELRTLLACDQTSTDPISITLTLAPCIRWVRRVSCHKLSRSCQRILQWCRLCRMSIRTLYRSRAFQSTATFRCPSRRTCRFYQPWDRGPSSRRHRRDCHHEVLCKFIRKFMKIPGIYRNLSQVRR